MGRKERLSEYFRRLTQLEKDIVIGRAAELCRDHALAGEPEGILHYQASKGDVEEALRKTRRLKEIVQQCSCPNPACSEKDALKLVLEQAAKTGKITYHASPQDAGQALRNFRCQSPQP